MPPKDNIERKLERMKDIGKQSEIKRLRKELEKEKTEKKKLEDLYYCFALKKFNSEDYASAQELFRIIVEINPNHQKAKTYIKIIDFENRFEEHNANKEYKHAIFYKFNVLLYLIKNNHSGNNILSVKKSLVEYSKQKGFYEEVKGPLSRLDEKIKQIYRQN